MPFHGPQNMPVQTPPNERVIADLEEARFSHRQVIQTGTVERNTIGPTIDTLRRRIPHQAECLCQVQSTMQLGQCALCLSVKCLEHHLVQCHACRQTVCVFNCSKRVDQDGEERWFCIPCHERLFDPALVKMIKWLIRWLRR